MGKDAIVISSTGNEQGEGGNSFPLTWNWGGVELIGDGVDGNNPRYTYTQNIRPGILLDLSLEHNSILDAPIYGQPTHVGVDIIAGVKNLANPPILGISLSRVDGHRMDLRIMQSVGSHLVDVQFEVHDGHITGAIIDETERPSEANGFQGRDLDSPTMFKVGNIEGDPREVVTITHPQLVNTFTNLGLPLQFKGGNPEVKLDELSGDPDVKSFPELFEEIQNIVYNATHDKSHILPESSEALNL